MDKLSALPKKTLVRQSSDAFVKHRHFILQQYINGLHSIAYLRSCHTYRQFLKMNDFLPCSTPIRPYLRFVQNKMQNNARLSNFDMIQLSSNVFISIAGCHPDIAYCSTDKAQLIQHRTSAGHSAQTRRPAKDRVHEYGSFTQHTSAFLNLRRPVMQKFVSTATAAYTESPSSTLPQSRSPSRNFGTPSSPLTGKTSTGNTTDGTQSPTSTNLLPAPNQWSGCIQIWYYDSSAMHGAPENKNAPFSWWLEARGEDNKNFYGWNKSTATSKVDSHTQNDHSFYGGVDELAPAEHELQQQQQQQHEATTMKSSVNKSQPQQEQAQAQRVKEISRELDCIFLNEVPTAMYFDATHHQLFVGTLMGNVHRFKIIHSCKIEATGILPHPNIYSNVCNVHSLCSSSRQSQSQSPCTYVDHPSSSSRQSQSQSPCTYVDHPMFGAHAQDIDPKCRHNQQRIHRRLYQQRQLLKLRERQIHHKQVRHKRSLISDHDGVYNRAILSLTGDANLLYVADANSNIHAFELTSGEFAHTQCLSLEHYLVAMLQTEYKMCVDNYYQQRLTQYRTQHQRMMFQSSAPKDIHCDPLDPFANNNNHDDGDDDDQHDTGTGTGTGDNASFNPLGLGLVDKGKALFSAAAFLKARNLNTSVHAAAAATDDSVIMQRRDDDETVLRTCGISKEYAHTLSQPMRIGSLEADTAYEMYFDELVFSTTFTKQKRKILQVSNKLSLDLMVTDLVRVQDSLIIATNLPYLTLQHLRVPSAFNVTPTKISMHAMLESPLLPSKEESSKHSTPTQKQRHKRFRRELLRYTNALKHKRRRRKASSPLAQQQQQDDNGYRNMFGTISNFDATHDVLYSIPNIGSMHRDFLIYDEERVHRHQPRGDSATDMRTLNPCTIFVWSFTTHIQVTTPADINGADSHEQTGDESDSGSDSESDSDSLFSDDTNGKQTKQKQKHKQKKKKKKRKHDVFKDRTWHLKCEWKDSAVQYACQQFTALVYCASIECLAVAGVTGYIALFNAGTGQCMHMFLAHADTVTKLLWLEERTQLISTALDGTIKIWTLQFSKKPSRSSQHTSVLLHDDEDPISDASDSRHEYGGHENGLQQSPLFHVDTNNNNSNPQFLSKTATESPAKAHNFDQNHTLTHDAADMRELQISDDDCDLDELKKCKYDVLDDPFSNHAFTQYLDKKGQSLEDYDQLYYKPPPKTQQRTISSKELFATQTVLSQEASEESKNKNKTKNKPKSGFKTVKVKTIAASPPTITNDDISVDDIEQYIAQQSVSQQPMCDDSPSFAVPSEYSPDPSNTTADMVDDVSTPEPVANCAFQVVKKQRPKKKRKKKKEDERTCTDKLEKKKRKKKREKESKKTVHIASVAQPEDCTIRYDTTKTYSGKIASKLFSNSVKKNSATKVASTNPFDTQTPTHSTNPFDDFDEEDNGCVGGGVLSSTNPFHAECHGNNQSGSTNPFIADMDLP
eukprot:CAMPEP_0202733168 /NCGR_PEP_ID=MMETSP1385-20130828/188026_1 /ASSEMBLY_ACC=CAM_ASM_000861 /TAXON_ID=933848 /ORGANISM="Elphidium margaritaceum" /LENGTH=1463 /DNA_ID=CAMNT_0049399493 /DNA_START=1 /DNA_END=4392 /DNA_ORIENTATION=+